VRKFTNKNQHCKADVYLLFKSFTAVKFIFLKLPFKQTEKEGLKKIYFSLQDFVLIYLSINFTLPKTKNPAITSIFHSK